MWFAKSREQVASEKGFLALAGHEPDQPLRDVIIHFRQLVSSDLDWADSRKKRFRVKSSVMRLVTLALTAASTVVLGLFRDNGESIALPMVAGVTLLSAVEAFYNWRPRWVLMEETRYRRNRLRDEIDYYLVVTPTSQLEVGRLEEFFREQQLIWNDVSQRWTSYHRTEPGRDSEPVVSGRKPTEAPT